MDTTPKILFRGTTEKELESLAANGIYSANPNENLASDLVKRFTVDSASALNEALEYSWLHSSEPRIIILLNPRLYTPILDEFFNNYFDINIAENPIDLRGPDAKVLKRKNIEDIVLYNMIVEVVQKHLET